MRDLKLSKRKAGRNGRTLLRAQRNTTTLPVVDSLSPRRRSGERVRERGFQLAAPIRWKVPLSPALPARASQGEGAGGFRDALPFRLRRKYTVAQAEACGYNRRATVTKQFQA